MVKKRLAETDGRATVVIDIETTGLYPSRGDSICELALIQLQKDGNFLLLHNFYFADGGFSSGCHDSATVTDFESICDEVGAILAGCLVIGHHITFDYQFLAAEFRRVRRYLPKFETLCTMRLAKALKVPVSKYSLESCCAYFGIMNEAPHTAMGDAYATAKLYRALSEIS